MSLQSRLSSLISAIGADIKNLRTDVTSLQAASVATTPLDPFHYIGATSEPVFVNGWRNYDNNATTPGGGLNRDAAFRKDQNGRVFMKGCVKDGGSNPMFTLPVGYRPKQDRFFYVTAGANAALMLVTQLGVVTINNYFGTGSSIYVFLDQIFFDTEDVTTVPTGPAGSKGDKGDKGDTGLQGANLGTVSVNNAFLPVNEAVEWNTQIDVAAPVVGTPPYTLSSLTAGRRILLTQQADPKQNGIWVAQGVGQPLVRATDADDPADFYPGRTVVDGRGGAWVYSGIAGPVIGTDNITWIYTGLPTGIRISPRLQQVSPVDHSGPYSPLTWNAIFRRPGRYMFTGSASAYSASIGLKRLLWSVRSQAIWGYDEFYFNTINNYYTLPTVTGILDMTAGVKLIDLAIDGSAAAASDTTARAYCWAIEIQGGGQSPT